MENDDNYEENCRKEFFKLKRELKISELLLDKKKEELKEEKEKNEKLNKDAQKIVDESNKLSNEIEDFEGKNKQLEEEIKLKNSELEKLVKKINEGKLVPLDNYSEDIFEKINYENYKIFQMDF